MRNGGTAKVENQMKLDFKQTNHTKEDIILLMDAANFILEDKKKYDFRMRLVENKPKSPVVMIEKSLTDRQAIQEIGQDLIEKMIQEDKRYNIDLMITERKPAILSRGGRGA